MAIKLGSEVGSEDNERYGSQEIGVSRYLMTTRVTAKVGVIQ